MGLYGFSNDPIVKLPLSPNNADAAISTIESMQPNRGTYISSSLDLARGWLNKSENRDSLKLIITLSDGVLSKDNNEHRKTSDQFSKIHADGISTISIFVDNASKVSFPKNNPPTHQNVDTSTSEMEKTLTDKIAKAIYSRAIAVSAPSTTFNLNNAGIIPGDDKIILQVDAEILHGATLYIEYIISVTSAFDTKNIVIEDIPNISLRYNANQKMLTENRTNSSYGWTYDSETKHLISKSGSTVQKAANAYTKKLLLSTVLSSEFFNSPSTFGNSAKISLQNATTGNPITIDKSTDGSDLKALEFLIIPPTGVEPKTFNFHNILLINVSVIIIFTCIFVLSYIFFKIRKNKGS